MDSETEIPLDLSQQNYIFPPEEVSEKLAVGMIKALPRIIHAAFQERDAQILKAMTAVRLKRIEPGDHHFLAELQEIERVFYKSIGVETYYEKLLKWVDDNLSQYIENRSAVPIERLRDLDEFTRRYFEGKLTEIEGWLVRGFVIGSMIEDRERTGVIQPLKLSELPVKVTALPISQRPAAEWVAANAGKNLIGATRATVSKVADIVYDGIVQGASTRILHRRLEEEFMDDQHETNRNWKRVAITETTSAFNQGYLSKIKVGEWVIGLSFPDACADCKSKIDNRIYPVISPTGSMAYEEGQADYAKKAWLWENTVWVGKSNIGRRRTDRKRMPDGSMGDRPHNERFMPAIPQHSNCRCRWVRINPETQYVSRGRVFIRFGNEAAWKKWHDEYVTPVMEQLAKYIPR